MTDNYGVEGVEAVPVVPDLSGFIQALSTVRSALEKVRLDRFRAAQHALLSPSKELVRRMQITGTDLVRMTQQPTLDRITQRLQERAEQ